MCLFRQNIGDACSTEADSSNIQFACQKDSEELGLKKQLNITLFTLLPQKTGIHVQICYEAG